MRQLAPGTRGQTLATVAALAMGRIVDERIDAIIVVAPIPFAPLHPPPSSVCHPAAVSPLSGSLLRYCRYGTWYVWLTSARFLCNGEGTGAGASLRGACG